jgi:hypothetical protein
VQVEKQPEGAKLAGSSVDGYRGAPLVNAILEEPPPWAARQPLAARVGCAADAMRGGRPDVIWCAGRARL